MTGLRVLRTTATAIYNIYFHPLRKIPGPKLWIALPLLKNLHMMGGHLDFKIRAHHEKYGDVVRFGPNEVGFICPEAWKDIYGHGHAELPKNFPKGTGMNDGNIVYSNAANHFRLRRAMLPAFSDKALRQQEPLIRVYVDLLMKRLGEVADKGESANMIRWYNFTTFDLIADLAYGEELHGLAEGKSNMWIENIENLMKLMPILVLVTISPLLSKVLQFVAGPKIRKSQAKHREASEAMAMKRINRKEQADRGDFMDYMMRSRGEKHEMTDAELISNCDLLMIAGSETTASLLSGVTYWLLKTPRALEKVTEEVRTMFEREEDIDFKEASAKLPYMLACLDEALRIFPSIPLSLSRQTLPGTATPIAGMMIPENTKVGVHQLSAFHSERNFHRAKEFIPERWLPETTNDPSSPFYNDKREVHKPFSFGPRDCIGRNLAYHEMRLIMARLLWNFDLVLDEQSSNWHEQKIFGLWEKPPLMVFVKRKAG
ncbi:cytochrome P450 [Hyaloscypha variabilis F]|uniref:Cytochrome P450 n=1 Tax=Hyaloscypha variabilis (strain UAMH 11265 / GT02V1 / F) TaxID=1149755 RepID=A0A2J6R872_HYAVF|nr:cytochrome P450 [Hyaloscypha variabilis F]